MSTDIIDFEYRVIPFVNLSALADFSPMVIIFNLTLRIWTEDCSLYQLTLK